MLKEQTKQDKQLELIQRLEKELKSSKAKPALSVFVLPKDVKIEYLGETELQEVQSTANYAGVKFGNPPYKIEYLMLDMGIPTPVAEILTTYNDETLRWERRHATEGIVCWLHQSHKGTNRDYEQGYTSRLLQMLAPTIEPRVIWPSDTTRTSTAMELVKVVFGQRNKQRGNWSKFLRLRGAWNDQDEAKGWVDDNHMLDFSWDLMLQEPARFGVDFGQSMEAEAVREEQREAKYWWIDIPDLMGLVLKILPTLERQREKQLKTQGVEYKPARSVGRSRKLGGGAVEALHARPRYTDEADLDVFKKSAVDSLVNVTGWKRVDAKRYVEENGTSIESMKKALEEAVAQGQEHKGKKPSSSIK